MDEKSPIPSSGAAMGERAKAILKSPTAEWPRIAAEGDNWKSAFTGYAMPLAAIAPVCSLIGLQLFGFGYLGMNSRPPLMWLITSTIVDYVLALAGLFVAAFVANYLSPKFGGKESWPKAFRLVVYAMTAAWLAGIFNLVPMLSVLTILGLYSIYLLYTGCGPMMGIPKDKAVTYTAATVLVVIVVMIVISAISVVLSGGPTMGM